MIRLSKTDGIGGAIKQSPEDFIVEEITTNGTVLKLDQHFTPEMLGMQHSSEGKFCVFVLRKRNWNTSQALKTVAKVYRRGIKSTSFAGTKDRVSISAQLCSIFGLKPDQLTGTRIKDISISSAWLADSKVEMGELLGNRFTINVQGISPDAEQHAQSASDQLNGIFPNYFGDQRFGSRGNNAAIGIHMLKGEFEQAAMKFLTDTENETNADAIEARKGLEADHDFKKALNTYPQYLKYERQMLEYLSLYPTNYANAIRKLPRSLALMLVHAVEAEIFNKELEYRIAQRSIKPQPGDILCKPDRFGFADIKSATSDMMHGLILSNIVGYDTNPNQIERELLDGLGITTEMFKLPSMPELNCKGTYRVMFAPYKDLEMQFNDNVAKFSFSLAAGCYATVLLNEFMG